MSQVVTVYKLEDCRDWKTTEVILMDIQNSANTMFLLQKSYVHALQGGFQVLVSK